MPGALSVCMIFKNARHLLPGALDSLIPLAKDIHQYVFVDTGSSDDGPAYIRSRLPEAKLELVEHPWSDHFAEARNVALARARSPWVLFLDADERLAKESVPVLQHFLKQQALSEPIPEGIVCRRENLSLEGSVVSWDELTRLLRVQPKLRFTGRVHERPVYVKTEASPALPAKSRPLHVQRAPNIRLLHIAEKPQAHQNKSDYYLKLIEQERTQWPSPYMNYHWATSPQIQKTISAKERWACLQQALQESLVFADKAIHDLSYPQWAGVPVAACILECQFLLIEMNQPAEMLAFFETHSQEALLAESWGQAAIAYDLEEQWTQAQRCFYAALDPQHPMADPSQGWGSWRCHAFLAVLYERSKDWPAAWAHSRKALQQSPPTPFRSAMLNLQQTLSQQIPLSEATKLLEHAFASAYAAKDTPAILSLGCFLWSLKEESQETVFLSTWHPPPEARQTPFYAFFKALRK